MSYRMTIIFFTVFAGKTCSAVSPLPEDFYSNFDGDPFKDDAPHDSFMRSVFSVWIHRTASFIPQWLFVRSVHDRTTQRAQVCDESYASSQANELLAEPFFKRFHKGNDNKRG